MHVLARNYSNEHGRYAVNPACRQPVVHHLDDAASAWEHAGITFMACQVLLLPCMMVPASTQQHGLQAQQQGVNNRQELKLGHPCNNKTGRSPPVRKGAESHACGH